MNPLDRIKVPFTRVSFSEFNPAFLPGVLKRGTWIEAGTELAILSVNPSWRDLCAVRGDSIVYIASIPA